KIWRDCGRLLPLRADEKRLRADEKRRSQPSFCWQLPAMCKPRLGQPCSIPIWRCELWWWGFRSPLAWLSSVHPTAWCWRRHPERYAASPTGWFKQPYWTSPSIPAQSAASWALPYNLTFRATLVFIFTGLRARPVQTLPTCRQAGANGGVIEGAQATLDAFLGKAGYEGIHPDSAGNIYIVEDTGGATSHTPAINNGRQPNSFVYR